MQHLKHDRKETNHKINDCKNFFENQKCTANNYKFSIFQAWKLLKNYTLFFIKKYESRNSFRFTIVLKIKTFCWILKQINSFDNQNVQKRLTKHSCYSHLMYRASLFIWTPVLRPVNAVNGSVTERGMGQKFEKRTFVIVY